MEIFKTEFFVLMNEDSREIINQEIQNAYGKFIAHIDTISQVGNDYTSIIRKLNITRAELVFLSAQI
ncbi:MAG: hypothetical protein LBS88_00410 [Tannerellaceae bacterium]|jgi:hypothetical protein|nr:hypothetical protein [Tannerellaceae bacterium]